VEGGNKEDEDAQRVSLMPKDVENEGEEEWDGVRGFWLFANSKERHCKSC